MPLSLAGRLARYCYATCFSNLFSLFCSSYFFACNLHTRIYVCLCTYGYSYRLKVSYLIMHCMSFYLLTALHACLTPFFSFKNRTKDSFRTNDVNVNIEVVFMCWIYVPSFRLLNFKKCKLEISTFTGKMTDKDD